MVIDRFGGPDVLTLTEVPEPPSPGPGEVVVAIHAAGVNPLDAAVRSGRLSPLLGREFPLIVGNDGAGIVTAIGAGVSNVGIGDRVHGLFDAAPAPARHGFATPGTYAEQAVTRASTLTPVSDDVDMITAAAMPVAGLTAYQSLVRKARIERGSSVLVIGASGGVGTFATQIAVSLGANVTGVAGGSRVDLVRSLGAQTVIDHHETDPTTLTDQFDLVYDVSTKFSYRRVRHLVAPGGLFVANIGPRLAILSPRLRRPERRFGRYGFAWVAADARDLTALTAMVEAGEIRPCIGKVLPLADAANAHRLLESGQVFGKVVLEMHR